MSTFNGSTFNGSSFEDTATPIVQQKKLSLLDSVFNKRNELGFSSANLKDRSVEALDADTVRINPSITDKAYDPFVKPVDVRLKSNNFGESFNAYETSHGNENDPEVAARLQKQKDTINNELLHGWFNSATNQDVYDRGNAGKQVLADKLKAVNEGKTGLDFALGERDMYNRTLGDMKLSNENTSVIDSMNTPEINSAYDTPYNFAKQNKDTATLGQAAEDTGRLLLTGFEGIGSALGYGLEKTGIAPELGKQIQDEHFKHDEMLRGNLSDPVKQASQEPLLDANNNLNPNFGWTSLATNVIPSIPGSVAMGGAGGVLAKALGTGAKAVLGAETTASKLLTSGLGFGSSEGVFSAAQNADQWGQEQRQKPVDEFKNSPLWNKTLAKNKGNEEATKEELINQGQSDIFKDTAITTGALSGLPGMAGGMYGKLFDAATSGTKISAKGAFINALKGMGEEAAQEYPQSLFERRTTNQATKDYIDPNQDVSEGQWNDAAVGGLSGFAMGAMGAGGHIASIDRTKTPTVEPTPSEVDKEPTIDSETASKAILDRYSNDANTSTLDTADVVLNQGIKDFPYDAQLSDKKAVLAHLQTIKDKTPAESKEFQDLSTKVILEDKFQEMFKGVTKADIADNTVDELEEFFTTLVGTDKVGTTLFNDIGRTKDKTTLGLLSKVSSIKAKEYANSTTANDPYVLAVSGIETKNLPEDSSKVFSGIMRGDYQDLNQGLLLLSSHVEDIKGTEEQKNTGISALTKTISKVYSDKVNITSDTERTVKQALNTINGLVTKKGTITIEPSDTLEQIHNKILPTFGSTPVINNGNAQATALVNSNNKLATALKSTSDVSKDKLDGKGLLLSFREHIQIINFLLANNAHKSAVDMRVKAMANWIQYDATRNELFQELADKGLNTAERNRLEKDLEILQRKGNPFTDNISLTYTSGSKELAKQLKLESEIMSAALADTQDQVNTHFSVTPQATTQPVNTQIGKGLITKTTSAKIQASKNKTIPIPQSTSQTDENALNSTNITVEQTVKDYLDKIFKNINPKLAKALSDIIKTNTDNINLELDVEKFLHGFNKRIGLETDTMYQKGLQARNSTQGKKLQLLNKVPKPSKIKESFYDTHTLIQVIAKLGGLTEESVNEISDKGKSGRWFKKANTKSKVQPMALQEMVEALQAVHFSQITDSKELLKYIENELRGVSEDLARSDRGHELYAEQKLSDEFDFQTQQYILKVEQLLNDLENTPWLLEVLNKLGNKEDIDLNYYQDLINENNSRTEEASRTGSTEEIPTEATSIDVESSTSTEISKPEEVITSKDKTPIVVSQELTEASLNDNQIKDLLEVPLPPEDIKNYSELINRVYFPFSSEEQLKSIKMFFFANALKSKIPEAKARFLYLQELATNTKDTINETFELPIWRFDIIRPYSLTHKWKDGKLVPKTREVTLSLTNKVKKFFSDLFSIKDDNLFNRIPNLLEYFQQNKLVNNDSLIAITKFHDNFVKAFEANDNPAILKESLSDNAASSLFIYDIKKGTHLEPNALFALSIGSIQFLQTALSTVYNDDDAIRSIVGLKEGDHLPAYVRDLLSDKGSVANIMKNQLGASLSKLMGVTYKPEATIPQIEGFEASLGAYALRTLIDMKLLEETQIEKSTINAMKNQFEEGTLPGNQKTQDIINKLYIGATTFVRVAAQKNIETGRPEVKSEIKELLDAIKPASKELDELLNTSFSEALPSGSKTSLKELKKWLSKTWQGSNAEYTEAEYKALKKYNDTVYTAETKAMNAALVLDEEFIKQIALGERYTDVVQKHFEKTRAGKELQADNEYKYLMDSFNVFKEHGSLYFLSKFWKQGRVGMEKGPQNSKMMRWLFAPKGVEYEVDLANKESSKFFKLAVVAAFGTKIDQISDIALNEKFDALLETYKDVLEDYSKTKGYIENVTQEMKDTLLDAVYAGKEGFHSYAGLLELAHYNENKAKGKFTSQLMREDDGITNGPAIGWLLFNGGDNKKVLDGFAIFTDSHKDTFTTHMAKEGSADNYNLMAKEVGKNKVIVNNKIEELTNFLNQNTVLRSTIFRIRYYDKKNNTDSFNAWFYEQGLGDLFNTNSYEFGLLLNVIEESKTLSDTDEGKKKAIYKKNLQPTLNAIHSMVGEINRSFAKLPLMTLIFGSGINKIASNIGYIAIDSMYEKIQKIIRSKPKNQEETDAQRILLKEIEDNIIELTGYDIPLPLNEDKEEDASLYSNSVAEDYDTTLAAYSIEALKNFKLPTYVEKKLAKQIANVYVPIIRASVNANFQTFINNRKAINQIFDIGNTVLKTYIEHEVNLVLKDGLTKQKLLDIFEKAFKLMPSMKVPNFDGTEREIFYWNKDESSSTMPEFKVQVKHKKNKEILSFSYLDDKGEVHTSKSVTLNSSTDTGHAVGVLLEAIGVRTPIMTIHYTDSLPIKDVMNSNLISTMVHDARIGAANTSDEGSYLMNKKLLESINLLNPFKQATDYLQQVFDNLPRGDDKLSNKLKDALEKPLKEAFKNKQTVPHVQQGKRKVSPLIYSKENSGKQFKDYLGYLGDWVKYQTGVKNEIAKSIKAFGNYGGNATFKPQMVEAVKQDNFRELVAEEFKDVLKNNSLGKGNKPLNDITDKLVNLYTQVNIVETLQEFINRIDTLGLSIEQFKQHQTNIENKILGTSKQETKPSGSNKEAVTTSTIQTNKNNKPLGSTPNAEDLLTEKADLIKDVKADNIVAVSDSLPQDKDPVHREFLRNFVSQVIAPVVEATELLLFNKATYTYGQYSVELKKVAINLGQALQEQYSPFKMSAQEVFAHEFSHAVVFAAWLLPKNNILRNKIEKLFFDVRREFNKALVLDPSLEKWNYVFNNEDSIEMDKSVNSLGNIETVKHNRGIQEFIAFGTTNKEFRDLVKRLQPKQLKVNQVYESSSSDVIREASWLELITNVFKRALDSFMRIANGTNSTEPLTIFDKNVRAILAANNSKPYLDTTLVVDTIDSKGSELLGTLIKKGLKVVSKGGSSKHIFIRDVSNFVNDLPKIEGFESNKVFRDLTKLISNKTAREFVHDLQKDIVDVTKYNKPITNITIEEKNNDAKRNSAIDADELAWNTRVSLNAKQDKAYENGIVRADAVSVLDAYGIDKLIEFYKDKASLKREITSIKNQIPHLNSKALNLASLMLHGSNWFNGLTEHNAALIAKAGRNIPQDKYQKEMDLVTKLSRLYVIGLQDENQVKLIVDLLESNPEGMKANFDTLRELKKQELTERTPLTIIDGDTHQTYDPHKTIFLGTEEDAEELSNWNAKVIGNFERDPNDPLTTKGVLYLVEVKTVSDWQSQAMAFADINIDSTNWHSGLTKTNRFNESENREKADLPTSEVKTKNTIFTKNKSIVSRVATYNAQGKIIKYTYVLNNETKEKYLNPRKNIYRDIAAKKNGIPYRTKTKELNHKLVDALHKYWKELGHDARSDMKFVGSEGEYKDLWNMIPTETKAYIETKFGTEKGFYMVEEEIKEVFGYRKQSITNWIKPAQEAQLRKTKGNMIYEQAKRFGLNQANLKAIETIWIEGIALAKDTIVVKGIFVSAANDSSNFMTAKLAGVPVGFYIKTKIAAMRAEQAYRRDSHAYMTHLSLAFGNPKYITKEIALEMKNLEASISTNEIGYLHEEGLATTVAEEGSYKDKHQTMLFNKTERARRIFDKLPKLAKDTLKIVSMSEGTKVYKLLDEIAQMGDITSRHALIMWEAEKARLAGKDFDQNKAIDLAKFLFIQYHTVTNELVQYGNDIGLLMFSKFAVKTLKVLTYMVGHHAARLAALGIFEEIFGATEWIWHTGLNKLSNPFESMLSIWNSNFFVNTFLSDNNPIDRELFTGASKLVNRFSLGIA